MKVTKNAAIEIAEKYVEEHCPFPYETELSPLRPVRFVDEDRPRIFDVVPDKYIRKSPEFDCNPDELSRCWIVSFPRKDCFLLCSTDIVAVSVDTGKVLYVGSAFDEG
jgi:hypothetical protein